MAGAAFHALLPALSGGISLSSIADSCLDETASLRFIVDMPGILLGVRQWSRGWFLSTVARGDQLLSSSSSCGLGLWRRSLRGVLHLHMPSGGGGFCSRSRARAPLWPLHSSHDECAGHFSCGSGLAPSSSSGPLPAAGGLYSFFNSCCDHAHTTLPLWASLFGSAFHGTVSHLTIFVW